MTEQDDLYDFDLFNFDTGPSAEEIAAEQERQEIMWTSYVKEMLSVLTVYFQAKEEYSLCFVCIRKCCSSLWYFIRFPKSIF